MFGDKRASKQSRRWARKFLTGSIYTYILYLYLYIDYFTTNFEMVELNFEKMQNMKVISKLSSVTWTSAIRVHMQSYKKNCAKIYEKQNRDI